MDASSIEEVLDAYQPRRTSVRLCLRGDLNTQMAALREKYARALAEDERENRTPEAPVLARQLVELEQEAEDASIDFVFEALGTRAWADLLAEHEPRKEDRSSGLDHNPETFPYAAVAASCVSPRMDLSQAKKLAEKLSLGQWMLLYENGALAVNISRREELPKSGIVTDTLRPSV